MFLIDQKEGLSLEFSKLVSMMDYTRVTTIREIESLTVEEFDFFMKQNLIQSECCCTYDIG